MNRKMRLHGASFCGPDARNLRCANVVGLSLGRLCFLVRGEATYSDFAAPPNRRGVVHDQ